MKPDARRHNPNPAYLRGLVARTGLTQEQAAKALGISARSMRAHLSESKASRQDAPYVVQFALEALAGSTRK